MRSLDHDRVTQAGDRIARQTGLVPDAFPSIKAKRFLAVLEAEPLGYRVVRQVGSHRKMHAKGRPPLTFAFHDSATIPGGMVRAILVKQVGLSVEEARALL